MSLGRTGDQINPLFQRRPWFGLDLSESKPTEPEIQACLGRLALRRNGHNETHASTLLSLKPCPRPSSTIAGPRKH